MSAESNAEDNTFPIDADGETTLPVVDVFTGRGFVTDEDYSEIVRELEVQRDPGENQTLDKWKSV